MRLSTFLPAITLTTTPTVALAAVVVATAARAAESPVLPGFWDSKEAYSVLLSGGGHDRKCLTAAQVTQFLAAPQTKHYQCNYATRVVEDGRVTFRGGSCYSHSGRLVLSKVAVEGQYAPESFRLQFRFNYMVSSTLGVPGTANIEAHRISAECPADSSPGR